jgi:SAM-dependent methyltransferase
MNMQHASSYDPTFYQRLNSGSLFSARATLKRVWQYFQPQTVVDVGCGSGTWLLAASELGVRDIQGFEGSWVKKDMTVVPFEKIKIVDLSKPLPETGCHDLAISMEVAEHLPPSRAESFIQELTGLSKFILFSAAVPGQQGVAHLNEQWPGYWAKLFAKHGYLALDFVRPAIWTVGEVDWWYAQNAIVYIEEKYFSALESRAELAAYRVDEPLPLVHPKSMARYVAPGMRQVLFELLPGSLSRAFSRRWRTSGGTGATN